jgi:pSer/pThr/pTyr-binding forkhead associated (FHA) protein/tetratricopeptide (TPR) repeat protein
MLNLVIEDDEGRRTTVPLSRNDITIGRNEENLIRLADRNVSRLHARIMRDGERIYIEDKSRYGSRKNGRKFTGRTTLQSGDIVLIGDYRMQVVPHDATLAEEPTGEISSTEISQALDSVRTTAMPRMSGPPPMPGKSGPPRTPGSSTAEPGLAPDQQSRLRCTTDPFTGAEFTILDKRILVGSSERCDVVIEHESIAGEHARIITDGSSIVIENVDPVAALIVNGVVETRVNLKAGDTIGLGRLSFQFVAPTGVAAASATAKKAPAGPALMADDIDFTPPAARPAWLVPAIATGAVLVVAVIAFAVLPNLGGGGDPEVVEVATDDSSASAFATGQQNMNAARWSDAIAALGRVAEDHPQYSAAQDLKRRAEEELEHHGTYEQVREHMEDEDFAAAQTALDSIPRSSYYHTRAEDDGTERRILTGLIESAIETSHDEQAAGDTDAARSTVTAALLMAPDDARLRARLEQINNPEANTARPVPEVPDNPVVANRAEPEPAPEPVRTTTARPEPEPRAVAARPAPAPTPAPTPAQPREAAPAPTPTPVAAPAPTPARPSTVDEAPEAADDMTPRERASDLLTRARRLAVAQDYRESIRLLMEAEDLQPNNAQVQLLLHNNYKRINNNLRAADAARRYLALQPGSPQRADLEAWLAENAP